MCTILLKQQPVTKTLLFPCSHCWRRHKPCMSVYEAKFTWQDFNNWKLVSSVWKPQDWNLYLLRKSLFGGGWMAIKVIKQGRVSGLDLMADYQGCKRFVVLINYSQCGYKPIHQIPIYWRHFFAAAGKARLEAAVLISVGIVAFLRCCVLGVVDWRVVSGVSEAEQRSTTCTLSAISSNLHIQPVLLQLLC